MPDRELLGVFRDEVVESFDELSRILGALSEAGSSETSDHVRRAFRIMHNVKGAARAAGMAEVELLAHALEDALSHRRETEEGLDEGLVRLLRRGMNLIVRQVEGQSVETEILTLVTRISEALGPSAEHPHLPAKEGIDAAVPGPTLAERAALAVETNVTTSLRVETRRLDRLMGFAGELLAHHSRQVTHQAELRDLYERLFDIRADASAGVRTEIAEVLKRMESFVQRDRHELQRFGYLASEFGAAVKSVRMQPLRGWVPKWRRIVEEAADELGKECLLVADVGDIELDRQVIDGLRDPLMHLLRNAVDHGIELPESRLAAGKPPEGTVTVVARMHGSMVQLNVSDDGAGIDTNRIVELAVSRGLVEPDQADAMEREQVLELLFADGLSTSEAVSRLSGRGVGLDVVRSSVHELGGRIGIEAATSGGTTFSMMVPISLVSTKGLLVKTDDTVYALPLPHVVRTLRVSSDQVKPVDGMAAVAQNDAEPLRLKWLASLMGEARKPDPRQLVVVVVTTGIAKLGLVVRDVVGEAEFVAKRLPWNIRQAPGVSGAVVLGDGTLAIVLDVARAFKTATDGAATNQGLIEAARRDKARILVVDDSLTSRTLERNILLAAGYAVETAVDGEEGWELLQRGDIDLVVTDIQMPKVDGIELTRRVRGHPKLKQMPVVLVTSMNRPEDVASGSAAGADEYIVKGEFEQRKLLEAVARHL